MSSVRAWVETNWRVVGLWAAAAWLLNYAVSYWAARDTEAWMPEFWPVWFLLAAVAVAAFTLWPASRLLYRVAGIMGMVALGSRVPSVVLNALADGLDARDWRSWAGVFTFLALTAFWWVWWTRAVGPYHDLARYGLAGNGAT